MRILGIDPGFRRLGYACVNAGESLSLETYGVVENTRLAATKFNPHLNSGIEHLAVKVPKLLHETDPGYIVAEIVPAGKLGSNDSLVIAAITTCKVIAYQFGVTWIDVAANTLKKELTGDGKATKARVKNEVLSLFPEVDEAHILLKKSQKAEGEKATGFPQDVFDAIAAAVVGVKLLNGKEVQEVQEEQTDNSILSD